MPREGRLALAVIGMNIESIHDFRFAIENISIVSLDIPELVMVIDIVIINESPGCSSIGNAGMVLLI
jgi:hypothetical protein